MPIIDVFKYGVEQLRRLEIADAEIARQLDISPQNLWRKLHKAKTLDADFWFKFQSLIKHYKIKLPT